MCPWKVGIIQKSRLSVLWFGVDSENSTVSCSILLFLEKLYLNDLSNKTLTRSSSLWFNKVLSILQEISRSFIHRSENKGQRKR